MSFTSATCLIYAIYPVPPTILQAWEGKNFQLEASLDVGATVAGSSDENIGFMSGMSARSLEFDSIEKVFLFFTNGEKST